jgi:hypothetical protein
MMEIGGKLKVKLGLWEVEAPTVSDIRLIDGGKVVSPTRQPQYMKMSFSLISTYHRLCLKI